MSQKRVAIVLAALVATLTLCAGILLLMEGGDFNTPVSAKALTSASLASQLEPAAPLRSGAWNYIIIYESGDLAGSAASLADGQVIGDQNFSQNTVRPKANFHFVIDSARSRRGAAMDGELEVGTAWLNQEPGAPYAGWPDVRYHHVSPYNNAVGVCLIANLAREPLSDSQHQCLIQVVRELQRRLHIPREAIKFQWELEPNLAHANANQKAYADSFRASLE